MRILLLAISVLLAGCAQWSGLPPASSTMAPIQATPISKCMNLGSALEADFEGQWGYVVRRSDLVRIKRAGFDTIRLPVRWSSHADQEKPYTIDPELLARVDQIVGWAEQIGLNIIVNVHHFSGLSRNPNQHEPRLEGIWDQLATHYAGAGEFLIFETINEPHSEMTVARTDAINVRLLQRIRQDHPHRWVIIGTADWGQLEGLQASEPDFAERVILTFHEYQPFDFTHQGAPWTDREETGLKWGARTDVAEMMQRLDAAQAIQSSTGMPVFVGEFGVFRNVPVKQRARWTETLREGIEARGMSWCYWDFAGDLKVYDIEAEAWIPELKAALLD
ncbi:MAG: glycoside hydrolase family 5 protein [Hyphomonadaceae bacterium]|nr:glycoside hydrolase family 5 protein [Hyphomonadaceae bacterium]